MHDLKDRPGDAAIRIALRAMLAAKHSDECDIAFIEELGLCRGQVRVDLAVVNGMVHGYEIKSDRDSLRRLDRQVETYRRVFDRMTLVTGPRHLERALAAVPPWWGVLRIIVTSKGLQFRSVRPARANPSLDPRALVELLWLEDAIALLESHDAAYGVRGKPRVQVWDRICERISLEEIALSVRQQLKSRSARLYPEPPL